LKIAKDKAEFAVEDLKYELEQKSKVDEVVAGLEKEVKFQMENGVTLKKEKERLQQHVQELEAHI